MSEPRATIRNQFKTAYGTVTLNDELTDTLVLVSIADMV
jgi:hypothetical protein